jgi:ABC-type molybdenum transport system ATPase subunit/photorepair protein PhrA
MTIIKKIEIKDFFGRGDFEWNLDPKVNILGGKNGSGKSSIFRCCYSLLSGIGIKDAQYASFSNLFSQVELTFSNDWSLLWKKIPVTSNESFLDYYQKVQEDSIRIIDNFGDDRQFEDLKKEIQAFYLNSFEQRLSQVHQYELERQSTRAMGDPILLDLMIKDQINIRNSSISQMVGSLVNPTNKSDDSLKQFGMHFLSYGLIFRSLERFFVEYDRPFKNDFIFKKNGVDVGIEGLSTGEKQILLLLLMVSNTNKSPCIFFMDEPDLSMHIDWKEILVKELHELNPNMQIILSTHAPSVITGWQDRVREVEQLVSK